MNYQIIVISESGTISDKNNKKGVKFEDIVTSCFTDTGCKCQRNTNYAGYEIDIIAEDERSKTVFIIECKAKKTISSDD